MKTILIVEDNKHLQNIYKEGFENNHFRVLQSFTGIDATHIASEEKPDVILLDVMLPENKNGYDILKQFKNDDSLKSIPVIMLTSVPGEESSAIEMGAVAYLHKEDVDVDDILKQIKKHTSIFTL